LFYDLADNLCNKYPALTPFIVRREKFGEVIDLMGWIYNKDKKQLGAKSSDKVWKDKRGNVHIRREAKNDDWF
jgi:hypothetical protein